MALSSLSSHELSDLCIGKPPLRCLPATTTVGEALSALRRSGDSFLSVWTCDHHRQSCASGPGAAASERCRCVGQVSVIDVICFLCSEENLSRPLIALESPVSVLLPKAPELVNVKVLEPNSSLLEAIDCILGGAQNLIIPTRMRRSPFNPKTKILQPHNGKEYCWITQEDIVRFLFNSINLFSPLPSSSLESLNLIEQDVLTLHYDDSVLPNLPAIQAALTTQTAVAVIDDEGRLVGEISTHALSCFNETAAAAAATAAAIATLSAGDLMAYTEPGGPPEVLVQLVKSQLKERKLETMLELMEEDAFDLSPVSSATSADSSSSDDELRSSSRKRRPRGSSRRTETIICHPKSSMVAVMIQALAHRVSYAWVVEEDYSLIGMVTFAGMLDVFRTGFSQHLRG